MIKQPFDPGNLKIKRQKILFFFMDHNWHDANELCDKFGSAWNQRKNLNLRKKGHLAFISRFVLGTKSLWEYRLLTPNIKIDLEHTCLIPDSNESKLQTMKKIKPHSKPLVHLSLFNTSKFTGD